MTGEGEGVEDASTDGVVAAAIESKEVAAAAPVAGEPSPVCRNCGATVPGKFCGECAQPVHMHRSLLSLAHDILHSVFHFEGRFWRTVPLLVWRPGQLTRRYIDGERAKFVSPMALFLFTVFAMFAVFSFLGGGDVSDVSRSQSGHQAAIETTDRQLADLRARLAVPTLTSEERAAIEEEIADLETLRAVTQAFFFGGREDDAELQNRTAAGDRGRLRLPRVVNQVLQQLNENPGLLLYKLKTNGYKFSWALVPMSIPFVWLLFFWRRDIRLYDHAVFVTYSISFMMLLVMFASLLGAAGVGSGYLEALFIVPPVHIYRQLRGAYGLSRAAALVRLLFVLISAMVVLGLFIALLLLVGAL